LVYGKREYLCLAEKHKILLGQALPSLDRLDDPEWVNDERLRSFGFGQELVRFGPGERSRATDVLVCLDKFRLRTERVIVSWVEG
jgi:hypothetical protein